MAERARSGPLSRPVLSVAVLLAFAVLVGLGAWQIQRLQWKQDLLADIEAAARTPAAPLAPALAEGAKGRDLAFARVQGACPGLDRAAYLKLYALHDGTPGSRLISACRLESGPYETILVDRGFVAETVFARPPVEPSASALVAVRGVLRRPEAAAFFTPENDPERNRWFWRDVAGMAAALGVSRPAPWVLMLETSTNPEWPALDPVPLPTEIPNNHLGYALTWFGLAAALLAVYAAMLRRLEDKA